MNRVSRRSAAEAAEALLEAGRTEPALDYDVQLGLARHQDWLRNDAPVPEWAHAGVATATKSTAAVVIKTIVSTVLVGALAAAAWQARELLQPSAAMDPASSPGVVATQPAAPAELNARVSEPEAAMAPIPIPVPEQAVPSEYPAPRAARTDFAEKRAARNHRAKRDARAVRARSAATTSRAASVHDAVSAEQVIERSPEAEISATAPHKLTAAEDKPLSAARKPPPEPARKPQQPEDLIEMQQVATAEQLLERSPARALKLVREGDKRFARGYFQQERAYIAIMALIRLGRTDEARTRAASFAKQFPALPYGARIRSALDAASGDSTHQ